ncbi:MAG TPA: histidine triad nucleotide-binding protein [Jatrophihabitans sp.]|jgi:histidine triad (HIT) family protein
MAQSAVEDCLFCKISAGDIPATIVWEDERAVAFADINPQAPTHVLVIPRKHVADIAEAGEDPEAAADLLHGVAQVARHLELEHFRTVFNTGTGSGQSVFHVHGHVLAGRQLQWPPG